MKPKYIQIFGYCWNVILWLYLVNEALLLVNTSKYRDCLLLWVYHMNGEVCRKEHMGWNGFLDFGTTPMKNRETVVIGTKNTYP
jgi:hypothetical protein